jgi:hypothetical protein
VEPPGGSAGPGFAKKPSKSWAAKADRLVETKIFDRAFGSSPDPFSGQLTF